MTHNAEIDAADIPKADARFGVDVVFAYTDEGEFVTITDRKGARTFRVISPDGGRDDG